MLKQCFLAFPKGTPRCFVLETSFERCPPTGHPRQTVRVRLLAERSGSLMNGEPLFLAGRY